MHCPLCNSTAAYFKTYDDRLYNRCTSCASVFLDTRDLPFPQKEKQRYDLHENTLQNKGYVDFLSPLVQAVIEKENNSKIGLDYGSGPNPVLSKILESRGYSVFQYDTFYSKEEKNLELEYDFIICCEVIEHFHNPAEEFKRLKSLLKVNGSIYCKTSLLNENIDFDNWSYKNDFTHSFFYTQRALGYIKDSLGFTDLIIQENLFILKA
ncbi:class I SAM-dependent methyltransferase [Leeuwenhoekiella marinoflava]|uniref:Methyltransferase family protein n=2 Tax=Leeuwenhoekiella marinoflava TaxID=988 RepID=A0A4Q0PQL6_9FLAO|nr:class I SAM-dependent methyltransferase [Leeuwenhoekiella marinoflava]RXG32814.1 methyltransferase family protein [Leeuwenhoekiella marinoflava]SHE57686.1 Methyltransferase domain-containing protein [Leeuwenhoekiella marinoflava DSM 3653]